MKRPLLILSAIFLSGCSTTKEEVTLLNLYDQKDEIVVASYGDKELKLGELKRDVFENHILSEINSQLELKLLMEKYQVTEDDIQKKIDAYNKISEGAERFRSYLVLEAVAEKIEPTEAELLKTYEKQFKASGKPFEEVRDEVKKNASFEIANKEKIKLMQTPGTFDIPFEEIKEELNAQSAATYKELSGD